MNIALLGFGTVGKAFYELTLGRSDLRVTSVLSRRPRPELPCTVTNDFDEIVRDRSVGIVVEVMGGLEPAYRYICAAMRAGKHVVTANKQLVCAHYDELLELARECGVSLRCTAAAGGGIPWLTSLSRAAAIAYNKAVDLAHQAGIDKKYPENYIEELSAKDYAEIYTKVKISKKYLKYLDSLQSGSN